MANGIVVKFDTNNTHQPQATFIAYATPTNGGAMSPEQAAKLASLTPGGGGTLAQAYVAGGGNDGTDNTLGDETEGMNEPLELRAPIDGELPENNFNVIDVHAVDVDTDEVTLEIGVDGLGAGRVASKDVSGTLQASLTQGGLFTNRQLAGPNSPLLAIASNAVTLTSVVARIGDGLLKNMTPILSTQSGLYGLIPTGGSFSTDATGNISRAIVGAAGELIWFWYDAGTGKFYPAHA